MANVTLALSAGRSTPDPGRSGSSGAGQRTAQWGGKVVATGSQPYVDIGDCVYRATFIPTETISLRPALRAAERRRYRILAAALPAVLARYVLQAM